MNASTPLIKRTHILWLAIFLPACLALALDHNMSFNEVVYLPQAKQFVDSRYLSNDAAIRQSVPHLYAFNSVMAPLTLTLPLVGVSILGRIIGFALLGIGLARIARKLDMDLFAVVLAGGVFAWLGQSISAGEWVFRMIEAKVFAYAALFLGIDALMENRLIRSALFFGIATSFHVLVGGWGSLALAAVVLVERLGSRRDRVLAAILWCVAASLGIFAAVSALSEPAGSVDTVWLSVYFRNPHHLDPLAPGFFTLAIWTAPVGLWLLMRNAVRLPRERRILARFVLATAVPFALGLIARLLPGGDHFLQFYPFRVGGSLLLLFGVAPGLVELLRWIGTKPARWVLRAATAAILAIVCVHFVAQARQLERYSMGGIQSRPLYDACFWVREHTPGGVVILAPPGLAAGAYMMDRAVVVSFSAVPPGKQAMAEWYDRLVRMNGGSVPTGFGFPAREKLDHEFNDLPAPEYEALGRRYGARYLLVRRRAGLELPRLFENRGWMVCSLP